MTTARPLRWAVGTLGAAVWLLAPIVLLVRAEDVADRQTLRDDRPTWAPVRADTEPSVAEVGLRLEWSRPAPMVAPAWTGLVEEVLVAPGDPVTDGQPVLVAAGVRRLAMVGRPIGRTLAPGDRGPDVAVLNDMLARRGWPSTPGDRFTARTSEGTRALSETIGLTPTAGFDPAWVVHLPEQGAAVATIDLTVGAPVPAAGTPIATFAARLVGATVIAPRAEAEGVQAGGAPPGGGPDSAAPTDAAPPVDPDLLAAEAVPLPEGAQLRVADVDLDIRGDRTAVTSEALGSLDKEVEPLTEYVPGEAVVAATEGAWVVPSAAVITGEAGACLRVRTDGRERTVRVAIEGGRESQTRVVPIDGALSRDDEVQSGAPAGRRGCA